MANKDFYDRIADALEIISGDDSHVDDIDKNMDYYKRIAEALENIAESGGGSSSASNSPLLVTMSLNENQEQIGDKTFKEVKDAFISGRPVFLLIDNSSTYEMITGYNSTNRLVGTSSMHYYTADSDNDYLKPRN